MIAVYRRPAGHSRLLYDMYCDMIVGENFPKEKIRYYTEERNRDQELVHMMRDCSRGSIDLVVLPVLNMPGREAYGLFSWLKKQNIRLFVGTAGHCVGEDELIQMLGGGFR